MLADVPGFEVVGEATNGRDAIELCGRTRPALVLMDLRMPEMDGLEATRVIKQEHPKTCVFVMTMYENPDYLLQALRAGPGGYILKDADYDDVLSAIQKALSGDSPLAPELAARLLRRLAFEGAREPAKVSSELERARLPQQLTPRELEVLELMAAGKTNREIAEEVNDQQGHRQEPRRAHNGQARGLRPNPGGRPGVGARHHILPRALGPSPPRSPAGFVS